MDLCSSSYYVHRLEKDEKLEGRVVRFCGFFTPEAVLFSERRHYYKSNLPYVVSQPARNCDAPAAILETNASSVTLQHDWDAEWSQQGLASRLSQQV